MVLAPVAIVLALAAAPASRTSSPPLAVPLFVESAAETGLAFVHDNHATGRYFMPEVMGPGAALFDYDGDGDLDVFLVQWGDVGTFGAAKLAAPTRGSCRLFRNELIGEKGPAGSLRFTDVTAAAGLARAIPGMGVAIGDYDNDGDLDLFLTGYGSNVLYRNEGNGTFVDVTERAGVRDTLPGGRWNTSAAFVDVDRDDDLDLFIAAYLDVPPSDASSAEASSGRICYDAVGARDYCSPRAYRHMPDRLLRNNGDGTFTDVSDISGITKADGAGLGAATGDYNGDGWPDLYVANDATPNQLWINQKNGTFVDEGPVSGAAVNAAGNPEGSMGIASGDYDADGDEDLFVTNIVGESFVLYVNNGRAEFDDSRVKAGLAQPTAAFTGFGTDWIDVDNDGWLDLFIANGAVNIVEAQRGDRFPFRMRNQLFRNLGTGRFEEIAASAAGPAFARAEVHRGAAFGDVDNDGDVDILVTTNNGPVRLLLNQTLTKVSSTASRQAGEHHHWLQVRLEQPAPRGNRFAVGARIGIERAGKPTLWRRVRSDGSYLSASDLRVHVGLGDSARVDAITVAWPGVGPGPVMERWTNVGVDRLVTLRRGTGQ